MSEFKIHKEGIVFITALIAVIAIECLLIIKNTG